MVASRKERGSGSGSREVWRGRQGGILHMSFANVEICMKERWAGVNTCGQLHYVVVWIFEVISQEENLSLAMDNGERKIIHCIVKGGEWDEIMGLESMWQLLGHCWSQRRWAGKIVVEARMQFCCDETRTCEARREVWLE